MDYKSFEYINTTVVNGVSITTYVDFKGNEEVYHFPILYKKDKLERESFWKIYVFRDAYYRFSGIKGGKVREYDPVVAVPKNVGKINQTTGEKQALFEAFRLWKDKKVHLYTEEDVAHGGGTVDNVKIGDRVRPMLSEKYPDIKPKFPCAVSPKLDGVRCMIYLDESGGVCIVSRKGKPYLFLDNIKREAYQLLQRLPKDVVLDGELYSHIIPFNTVAGSVRTQTKRSPHEDKIAFFIFDLYLYNSPSMSYAGRIKVLEDALNINTSTKAFVTSPYTYLQFIFYDIANNDTDISHKLSEYCSAQYEGLMVRNLDSAYALGRRSRDLLKFKEFEDKEFKIVNVLEGVGSEQGASIFECVTEKGETFTVRPRGTIEYRRKQFIRKDELIGKFLTVRYQPTLKEETLPRFPVGIIVRDYE
jgi:ATP-dependent DNA ligase